MNSSKREVSEDLVTLPLGRMGQKDNVEQESQWYVCTSMHFLAYAATGLKMRLTFPVISATSLPPHCIPYEGFFRNPSKPVTLSELTYHYSPPTYFLGRKHNITHSTKR